MWTISNFHDKLRCLVKILIYYTVIGFFSVSCHPQGGVYVIPRASREAPDAPRQTEKTPEEKPPSIDNSRLRRPVELKSVTVRRLDSSMAELAGTLFMKQAKDPLVIEVHVQIPFDGVPRTSSPIIVLNNNKLMNSRGLPGTYDKLVAFLPDRSLIKNINSVVVVWLGNEELTMTKRPLTFREEDIGE